MAIIETLIEITILILPIREIHRLQLSTKKKYLLSLMFALGGFVIITAIIRVAILYRPNQTDLDLTQGDIWFNVHLGTAIISACLPTYGPLVSHSSRLLQSFQSGQGSYPTDDTRELTTVKKSMRDSRSSYTWGSSMIMEVVLQTHTGARVTIRQEQNGRRMGR